MRKKSTEERHMGIRKVLYLGASVLIFSIYLIFSYNNFKGRSCIYEPVYISLEGSVPDGTSLELTYQTIHDPTRVLNATLISARGTEEKAFVFKIDSTYRLRNFSIYFLSFREDEDITISAIKASNADQVGFSFSLKKKDIIPSGNLSIDELDRGAIRIVKIPYDKPSGSSLFFYARNLNNSVLQKSGEREPVFPSLTALLAIVMLGTCLFYCLYPALRRLNWNGISPGVYLLALAILIMPTGEKLVNLLLSMAIIAGFIQGLREGTIRNWRRENAGLLIVIFCLIVLYLIVFLLNSSDPSTQKLIKIKYGLPLILLAIAFNASYKREIRMHYAALLAGVIISVFMHLGWMILLYDTVELKSKLFSRPQYFMESAVFSRIHHSYLSILYLAGLATILIKRDIIELRRHEIIIFSLLILTGLLFAYSRAAILSLMLILLYFGLKILFSLLKIEINHIGRILAATALSIGLLILVFADLKIDHATENEAVKGLATRMEIWGNAGDLIKQKPVFGRGPVNYKYALAESNKSASFNKNRWTTLNTHNQFLETAGMFGLPLALALAWFILFPVGFSRQSARYSDLIFSVAIIFGTAFFFESLLIRNLGVMVFGLCYGLLIKMKTIYGR